MSQLGFSIHQNPKEVGSNAREGMDLLVMAEVGGRERKSFPLPCPIYKLPAAILSQIRDGFPI